MLIHTQSYVNMRRKPLVKLKNELKCDQSSWKCETSETTVVRVVNISFEVEALKSNYVSL